MKGKLKRRREAGQKTVSEKERDTVTCPHCHNPVKEKKYDSHVTLKCPCRPQPVAAG